MDESKMNTKEQFAVLILSTIVGFAASKFTENRATQYILSRKS